jgi:hypothetical protein
MRLPLWSTKATSLAVLALLLVAAAPPVFSQPKTVPAPAASPVAPTEDELIATRQQLLALLRTSPTLQNVVATDPSLLADQDYVARTNPQLAAFLTQHPEVARNPDFYLFADLSGPGRRPVESLQRRGNGGGNSRLTEAELHREYMVNITTLLGVLAFFASFLWLIRILLENRRWSRLFRLQSEVHAKLIDRFATNQELLHYMETEPGKRFLEAAPIPIDFDRNQRIPGGLSRVLGPLQFGIVLSLLGMGLLILHRSLRDFAEPLLIFGMVALMPGLGFIISAIVTWRISAQLGLMPQPAQTPDRQ